MPIYEFKCAKCSHVFEFLARNAEHHPDSCPACGAAQVEKQMSAAAVKMGSSAGSAPVCRNCPNGPCRFDD